MHVLSAKEGEINNPAIKQLCVTRIETRRVFQSNCHPQCPAEGINFPENESASVWVVLYPGTCVYRWNVDKRKIEAKFDAALQKPDNDCKLSPTSREVVFSGLNVGHYASVRISYSAVSFVAN